MSHTKSNAKDKPLRVMAWDYSGSIVPLEMIPAVKDIPTCYSLLDVEENPEELEKMQEAPIFLPDSFCHHFRKENCEAMLDNIVRHALGHRQSFQSQGV